MTLEKIVLVTGGTLTGLLAGLFYAFNVAVVPALRSLKGQQHVAAMQAINTKIQNPAFFLSFLAQPFCFRWRPIYTGRLHNFHC